LPQKIASDTTQPDPSDPTHDSASEDRVSREMQYRLPQETCSADVCRSERIHRQPTRRPEQ